MNKSFTLAACMLYFAAPHLAHWGGNHDYKMVCAVGFSHIRHVLHAQSRAIICANTHVQKIMDQTSVHGCAQDDCVPLSLTFDLRTLQNDR